MFYYIVTIILSLSVALMPFPALSADQINYVGSSTVGEFMKEAAGVYKDATFNINTEPESDGGENAVAAGKADLGGVARKVKPEILSKGVKEFLIGKDAIGVWANIKNPVKALSSEQLKDIFTGKISNWKEVGGSDTPINVYIVNPQSATRKVFQNIVLAGEDYGGKKIETVRPDQVILDKVASDEAGIGQLSFAFGAGHPALGKVIKITIGSQAASVNNPEYPITRPLYLITKGEPQGAVKKFIEWTLSEKGQGVVKKYFIGAK